VPNSTFCVGNATQKLSIVLEIEGILTKFFLCDLNLNERFAGVFFELAHCPEVGFLCTLGHAPELKILHHSLLKLCHDYASLRVRIVGYIHKKYSNDGLLGELS
jgi:hypothetical protein